MIPQHLKDQIYLNKFFTKCCIADKDCQGRVSIHHNLIFAGKQVNEFWALLPLCGYHHYNEGRKNIKSKLNVIMRKRSNGELEKYEKIKKYV